MDRCAYCFGPVATREVVCKESDVDIAKELVRNKVRMVVLGGGEPTLARNQLEVLEILKQGGIYTSVHTNGLTLTEKKLDAWMGLVDEIALPIDSADRQTQSILRPAPFLKVYDNLGNLSEQINERGINLGWHTVFTDLNAQGIPALHDKLCQHDFKFWRIYEYNEDLALRGWLDHSGTTGEGVHQSYSLAESLSNPGTPELGQTDCLLADFLRAEEAMQRLGDDRVCFVARKNEQSAPYFFIRPGGDVHYYDWCSTNQRRRLGNMLKASLPTILSKMDDLYPEFSPTSEDRSKYTEDWLEATADMPVWARMWDGIGFIEEELDEITDEKVAREVIRLANLWAKRNGCTDVDLRLEDYFVLD